MKEFMVYFQMNSIEEVQMNLLQKSSGSLGKFIKNKSHLYSWKFSGESLEKIWRNP